MKKHLPPASRRRARPSPAAPAPANGAQVEILPPDSGLPSELQPPQPFDPSIETDAERGGPPADGPAVAKPRSVALFVMARCVDEKGVASFKRFQITDQFSIRSAQELLALEAAIAEQNGAKACLIISWALLEV